MDSPQPDLTKAPYITTASGQVVHFLDPKPNQIKIHDIGWHLARQCRFNNHMTVWYSNAEHTLMGTKQASCERIAKEFFVHDFAEYVFGDIPSPVGKLCPEYKKMCDGFQNHLNMLFLGYGHVSSEVKTIDVRICATEQKILRRDQCQDWENNPYPSLTRSDFKCYNWQDAYFAFMDEFRKLFPSYRDAV